MNIQPVKSDSKKFKEGLELVNLVLESNLLKDFHDLPDGAKVSIDMPNNFKLYYKKVVFPADERRGEGVLNEGHIYYNNHEYLMKQQHPKLTKKQFQSQMMYRSIWVYDIREDPPYLRKEVLKNKCSKKYCEYIHDNLWFQAFANNKYGCVCV